MLIYEFEDAGNRLLHFLYELYEMTVHTCHFPTIHTFSPLCLGWSAGRDFLDVTARSLVYSYFNVTFPFQPISFILHHTAVLSTIHCSTLTTVIFILSRLVHDYFTTLRTEIAP